MPYIVKLYKSLANEGCFIADWKEGDPPRTTRMENIKIFKTYKKAEWALAKARSSGRDYNNAKIINLLLEAVTAKTGVKWLQNFHDMVDVPPVKVNESAVNFVQLAQKAIARFCGLRDIHASVALDDGESSEIEEMLLVSQKHALNELLAMCLKMHDECWETNTLPNEKYIKGDFDSAYSVELSKNGWMACYIKFAIKAIRDGKRWLALTHLRRGLEGEDAGGGMGNLQSLKKIVKGYYESTEDPQWETPEGYLDGLRYGLKNVLHAIDNLEGNDGV